jgi:toxin ParE1/3/4
VILVFDPLAQQEYIDAFEYYEAQEVGLGERFRRAVWSAVRVLEQFPYVGEEVRPEIRKMLLKQFPYKLIYSSNEREIYILAVAHGRREPDYWADRT